MVEEEEKTVGTSHPRWQPPRPCVRVTGERAEHFCDQPRERFPSFPFHPYRFTNQSDTIRARHHRVRPVLVGLFPELNDPQPGTFERVDHVTVFTERRGPQPYPFHRRRPVRVQSDPMRLIHTPQDSTDGQARAVRNPQPW